MPRRITIAEWWVAAVLSVGLNVPRTLPQVVYLPTVRDYVWMVGRGFLQLTLIPVIAGFVVIYGSRPFRRRWGRSWDRDRKMKVVLLCVILYNVAKLGALILRALV
jgi:hypothetical protein